MVCGTLVYTTDLWEKWEATLNLISVTNSWHIPKKIPKCHAGKVGGGNFEKKQTLSKKNPET